MELILYLVAIILAGLAAFGVTTKVNLVAAAIAFLAAAELATHVA